MVDYLYSTGILFLLVGESLMMLHSELKHQRKLVRGLKKKSLWSKSLEEVIQQRFFNLKIFSMMNASIIFTCFSIVSEIQIRHLP